MKRILTLFFIYGAMGLCAQAQLSTIIPQPHYTTQIESAPPFVVDPQTTLVYTANSLGKTGQIIQEEIAKRTGLRLRLANKTKPGRKEIVCSLTSQVGKEEGYTVRIAERQIQITARTPVGIFYAVQSLLQRMQSDRIPSGMIVDEPLYAWRGFMLDEARHFFGKETVKHYLDLMASLKLNRFHWHLTDEQAWRIEIKKYPRLTQIGSSGSWSNKHAPSAFYTQKDIREIVAYAAERGIMVIPEIDMPGHATAASRSYAWLSGGGEGRWQGFTFHPAKESTYTFIENVLAEIAQLFPAPYIHIGGDEVHYGNQSWKTDPEILAFIKERGLKNEVELEHYFIRRVAQMTKAKGKKLAGWDEMINAGVAPDDALIMWWRHDKRGELTNALNKGYDVVLCPRIPCYFDFVQDETQQIGRRWGKDFVPLKSVYNFPESHAALFANHRSQVVGLQANLWSERVIDKRRLDYMVFPRLIAIAEDGWTQTKDFTDFERRLPSFLDWLRSKGFYFFNYFNPSETPEPWGPTKEDVIAGG